MRIYGLTGGIASGKSLAARRFAALGAQVVDADALSRELLAPGAPLSETVIERFGPEIASAPGEIDRRALRRLIFADPEKRRALEALLHPAIWREAQRRFEAHPPKAPFGIFEAALLVESGLYAQLDGLIVVDCREEMQRARLALRDGATAEEIEKSLKSQTNRQERLRLASYVLPNDATAEDLDAAVEALFLRLAS